MTIRTILHKLLSPDYLYALNTDPLGKSIVVYAAWLGLFLFLGALARGWLRPRQRDYAKTMLAASIVGGLFVLLRFLAPTLTILPEWSQFLLFRAWTARVWPLSATLTAILPLAVWSLDRLPQPRWFQRCIAALTLNLQPDDAPLSWAATASLGLIHLGGLALLWHTTGRSLWWALPSFTVLILGAGLIKPHRLRLETLTPLLFSYGNVLLHLFLSRALGVETIEYTFRLPDPWSPWVHTSVMTLTGVFYTLWIQLDIAMHSRHKQQKRKIAPTLLVTVTVFWMLALVLRHHSHGATASDPYCYVQMTVDLATTGSPQHDFALVKEARLLTLPTWPTVHIGYHPPPLNTHAPTMWPVGWPVMMVPLYWLAGVDGLMWAAPLTALLALAATWALVNDLLYSQPKHVRWTVAALTVFLTATSPEGSERILVPMADAAAQLFSTLFLWAVLRSWRSIKVCNQAQSEPECRLGTEGTRRDTASNVAYYKPIRQGFLSKRWKATLFWGTLAGFSLGAAYWIRHPQLPLGVAMAACMLGIWLDKKSTKTQHIHALVLAVSFGLTALAVALPDLIYHQRVFGHWLHSESTEWFLLSPAYIGPSLFSLLEQGILRREELGYVLPFVILGLWTAFKSARLGNRSDDKPLILRDGQSLLLIACGVLPTIGFHLCYAALRPRDMIALFPVFYFVAALGLYVTWQRFSRRKGLAAALTLILILVMVTMRSYRSLEQPWWHNVSTFGHLDRTQRQALNQLKALTPDDAVIASMLNSGAIELYAERDAVHPTPWTDRELYAWTDALLAQDRSFYLLDDGEEMPLLRERLREKYAVRLVTHLTLPYFAFGGGNFPRTAKLYAIVPNQKAATAVPNPDAMFVVPQETLSPHAPSMNIQIRP